MTFEDFATVHFPAFLFTMLIIGVCVIFHFQILARLSATLEHARSLRRLRMVVIILALLGAHLVEIWVFALGYIALQQFNSSNLFIGNMNLGLLDILYFSGVTYSTVGYGDISPMGPARFMSAMEALTGLVLVAWSASFTYYEMGRFWRLRA